MQRLGKGRCDWLLYVARVWLRHSGSASLRASRVPMPARTEPRPPVVAVAATTARSLVICGVLLAGCQKAEVPSNPIPTFPGISIKVGALGNVAILGGVAPQRGEWEASRKGEIAIRDESLTPETLSSVDVILFPAQQLGELVNAGVLAPIPNVAVLPAAPPEDETGNQERREQDLAKAAQDDTFQYKDIAPAFREDVSKYGPERVALPCGGSALVLVYRRDAFASVPNREAARQAGLSLDAVSRPEPVEGVVDAIVRAVTARRAPRDVATTVRGRVEMMVGRHAPSLADRLVRRTVAARVAAGDFTDAPLAAGMVSRHRSQGR